MYTYAWYHWITFFYLYCFFGWIFESTYVSFKQHHFVNRGFLRLPMLPLYGSGAILLLWVSLPYQDNLILVYIAGFIAATALEYVTGAVMERLFKVRYWDYSDKKFNINGYICLGSSIAWGFFDHLHDRSDPQAYCGFCDFAESDRGIYLYCRDFRAVRNTETSRSTEEALGSCPVCWNP